MSDPDPDDSHLALLRANACDLQGQLDDERAKRIRLDGLNGELIGRLMILGDRNWLQSKGLLQS